MKKLIRYLLSAGIFLPVMLHAQKNLGISQVISKGGTAGVYQAFTDVTKLKNGDILSVFYAGESHVTYPSEAYPKSGRICIVRSKDNGKTWSKPITIYDDEADNRDPHISLMSDGTIVVTFFNTLFGNLIKTPTSNSKTTLAHYEGQRRQTKNGGIHYISSKDNGKTWSKLVTLNTGKFNNACSAPMRELYDGTWVYPAYHQSSQEAFGCLYLSKDKGKSWSEPIYVGQREGKYLPAETDVIQLKNGDVLAALRGDIKRDHKMHFAVSKDQGRTWSKVYSAFYQGHCPHFTRLSNDAIVLTYRAFTDDLTAESGYTGLRISYDEGKTWQGPYMIDKFWGAYASTVELEDKSLLITYYEEGNQSAVRVIRTNAPEQTNKTWNYANPVPLKRLTF